MEMCKAIMPVDLPLLFRRVEQARHVQLQTLAHAYALRRTLGPVHSTSFRHAAEAVAATALAITTESTSANEAAAAAARAAGWQSNDSSLMQLRELLGEATSMRVEAATAHTDQNARLEVLLKVQVGQVNTMQVASSTLNNGLTHIFTTLIQRSEPPPPQLADLSSWQTQALRSSSLVLDLSLLCSLWLARVHQSIRAPERATALIPEVMRTRRQLRTALEGQLKAIAAASLEQHAGAAPSFVAGGTSKREREYAADAAGDTDFEMRDGGDGADADEDGARAAALAAWEKRCALVRTQTAMTRQEEVLCWLLSSGLPEGLLQMLPEIPALLADLDHAPADADDGSDMLGPYEAAPSPDGEALDARRMRVLSISAASPPPLLAPTGPAPEFHLARLRAALALFSSGGGVAAERPTSADVPLLHGPHHGLHVALSAAEGGGLLEPYASPRLACFDVAATVMPRQRGERVVSRVGLCGIPYGLHVLWPRSAHAVRATRQAARELMRLQAAGNSAARHVALIHSVWCEPAPLVSGDEGSLAAAGGISQGSGVGRHLVCVQSDAQATSIADAHHAGEVFDVDELWRLLRGIGAGLVALHAVGLCCDGALTAENVALVTDEMTRERDAVLCSVGSWPGADAHAAGGAAPERADDWATAACEPTAPYDEETPLPQPASACAADVWALGIFIWRLRYPSDPPPIRAPGAAGLVPPASPPPVSPQLSHASGGQSLYLQRDAQLRECIARMLRTDPAERLAAREVLAYPMPLHVPPPLLSKPGLGALQQELLRLRRLAAHLPPATAVLDPANLPHQMLAFVRSLPRPEDLFRRIELTLADVVAGTPHHASGAPCSLPLEHAISLFWRAALTDTSCVPLLHVADPPLDPDPTPRLPPDAPLPPLNATLEGEGGAEGLARQEDIGRLLLLSLAHSVPLPSWLPPHIFKALLHRLDALELPDLQAARPRTACRCALVLASVVGPEFEWVDPELPEMPLKPLEPPVPPPVDDEMMLDGAGGLDAHAPGESAMQVGNEHGSWTAGGATGYAAASRLRDGTVAGDDAKMKAARRALRWRLLEVREQATSAIVRGFDGALPPSLSAILNTVSVEALMLAGCAGRDLGATEVATCLSYEGWDEDDQTPRLFNQWLHTAEPLDRRRLVLLATGRVAPAAPQRIRLPSQGWVPSPKDGHPLTICLTIRKHWCEGAEQPRALRGAWELLLPRYNDVHALASAMGAVLSNLPEAESTVARL